MGEEPGIFVKIFLDILGFPSGSQMVKKESACNEGDLGLIPGSERSPREGDGNPLQYSCLENSMDRKAWWAIAPWSNKELERTERLNNRLWNFHTFNLLLAARQVENPNE